MENLINPWVEKLLGVYQFSKIGNSDNRGLDTEFSKETYIPTKLDTELLPDIISSKFVAVFLTGNAGDGKTAFLEKVFIALKEKGAEVVDKNPAGWIVKFNEKIFKACYDASESEKNGKISSNKRLLGLYDHLRGDSAPRTNVIVLTAINDGKLHSFFQDFRKEFKWLSDAIFSQVFGKNKGKYESVCIVNLKERSLVDLDFDGENESSLFDQTLKIFTEVKRWEICNNCSSQKSCPIYYNAKVLGFSEFSSKIRARLKLLFTISHLRKQKHNTMRNIRSALSFIVTSNLECKDVHHLTENSDFNNVFNNLYFNSIFTSPDESLVELREIDPSLKLFPKMDKKISNLHKSGQYDLLKRNLFSTEIEIDFDNLNLKPHEILTSWRRRFYFEGDFEKVIDDFDEVESFYDLLPYYHLKKFIKNLKRDGNIFLLRQDLAEGIAQLEGIREKELAKKNIMIRITQNSKVGLTVCKKIPIDEFDVFTPRNDNKYLETIPNQMFLKHRDTGIQTRVNLDVYEILKRMSEGQLPSSDEQKPVLDELIEFKSRLQRLQSNDILLIESNGFYHHITKNYGNIIRVKQAGV